MLGSALVLAAACGTSSPGPALPADLDTPRAIARGRASFLEHCALCHGEHADGKGLRRSNLSVPPRDFTEPGYIESTTPGELFAVIRDGKRGTPMPSWRALPEDERWDLVSYLRSVPENQP